jgi:glycosyltransferase involved in cell wall biosynthesis
MVSSSVEMTCDIGTGSRPVQPEQGGQRVCMLAYAFYESDSRILQYATALAKRGDSVDVIALKPSDDFPEFEVLNGVNVYRIQSRTVNEKGLFSYVSRIFRFIVRSSIFMLKRHRQEPYDLVHVHNVPDFLVFASIFPKLMGVPIILDIHDLLPEFYSSKFNVRQGSVVFLLLTLVERCSAAFATHVIVANHLWCDRLITRSARAEKCSVVRNHPDLDLFVSQASEERKKNEKFLLTYPGSLNSHQGLDVAIRGFARIAAQMPEAEFHIYGEGPAKPYLIELTTQLAMRDRIIFHGLLPCREIAQLMAKTDLAIEPKRATSAFGNEALSTKILEFMALGVPVVASKTQTHAYYYGDSIIKYYNNDDEAELADAILLLRNDPSLRQALATRASRYASDNSWQVRKEEYLRLVDALTKKHRSTISKHTAAAKSRSASLTKP